MKMESINRVAVVGMGIMGPDIALAFAFSGYDVTALDTQASSLEKAKTRVKTNLSFITEEGLASSAQAAETTGRIQFTLDWEAAMKDARYVTEAVPENLNIKQDVFEKCDRLCPPETVIASNTSSMSMDEISFRMAYPERAVITHWFIPAHLMPVVEVVPGKKTSDETLALTSDLLSAIGKRPVICREHPAFIHNYIQAAMLRAALNLVEKGVCRPEDVDAVIQNGFALRLCTIGPLRMGDYAGLDTTLNLFRYVYGKTGEPAFKPPEVLEKMVANGDLGMKSGKGLYTYSQNQAEALRKLADKTVFRIKEAVDRLNSE